MFKRKTIIISIIIIIIIPFINAFYKKPILTTKKVNSNRDNLRINIDGVSSENLPTSGNYYLTKYKCYSNKTKVTWDKENYKLNITNKNKKAGVSCNLTFKSTPLLSEMEQGSYVKYQGKGGNVGSNKITCKYNGAPSSSNQNLNTESPNSCLGENAREDIDNKGTYGYCNNSNYRYYTTGWRIAYIDTDSKDPKAVIVAASAPECIDSNDINILNTKALKYCNNDYVDNNCNCNDKNKDGLCDEQSKDTWNINDKVFTKILSNSNKNINNLNITNCFNTKSTTSCGYNNDLIDNGGYYWLSSNDNTYWNPDNRTISTGKNKSYGLRPVIQLSSSVVVISGSGTIDNPYIIGNNDFTINNGSNYTNTRDVKLNIIGSNASQVCISNDSKCEKYSSFSNIVNWKLTSKDGTKNVYVYLKNEKGKIIANLHQKIILDTTPPTNNKLEITDKTANKITIGINSTGAEVMCISKSSDVNKCNWIPYQNKYNINLDDADGIKTIYAFFKDKAENISSKSLTYNCETCNNAYTVNYTFDGSKTLDTINKEQYINISTDDKYSWQIDNTNKYLKSSNKGLDNTTSNTSITIKPTTKAYLSFDYGVSSEANYDKLTIYILNDKDKKILVNSISGTHEDKITDYSLTANQTYKIVLNYEKDNKGSFGKDIGYIKNIIIK